jgi:predicted phosphodiesterase
VVCVSDTHNSQPALPDGDVLIHAGDLTQSGSLAELQAAVSWLRTQPHPVKIVVAGNHDLLLDASCDSRRGAGDAVAQRKAIDWGSIIYLENSEATITCPNGRRLRVYGSPRSPRHGNWAFQYPRGEDVWAGAVPQGIDVLVTHGPPRAHLDLLRLGCRHLLRELWRVRPRLHVFGHVHEGAGTEWLQFDKLQDAYERTVLAGGGLWNLMRTLKEFIRALFCPTTEAKCLLVNPSIVGGLRDNERRRPVKVVI